MCGKAVLGRYALQHKLIDLGGCIAALETDCGAEVCPVEKDIYYFDIMYECTHHKTYKNTSAQTLKASTKAMQQTIQRPFKFIYQPYSNHTKTI